MKKIVYLCNFSNSQIRERLKLRHNVLIEKVGRLFGKHIYFYPDFANWISCFIKGFESHNEFEYHVISPHVGLKKNTTFFNINGVNYHFFKCDSSVWVNLLKSIVHFGEITNYKSNRKIIGDLISKINPDLVVVCGAENPYYSLSVLDVNNKPILIQLQTLLCSPSRLKLNVGSKYRVAKESLVLKKASYLACPESEYLDLIHKINPTAQLLKMYYPVAEPHIIDNVEKNSDFVFYSKQLSLFKGIEDTIKALGILLEDGMNVTLKIIGNCSSDYKKYLITLLPKKYAQSLMFIEPFLKTDDLYEEVQRSKVAVLPGKTGVLNSTVRECMFMKIPVVLYDVVDARIYNTEEQCLIVAEMNNIHDLAKKMRIAICGNTDTIKENAFNFAHQNLSINGINNIINEEFHDAMLHFYSGAKLIRNNLIMQS